VSAEAAEPAEVRHEGRLAVLAALAVAALIPLFMPESYSPGPKWLLPAVEAGFLVAMAAADPGRIDWRSTQVRRLRVVLIVLIVGEAAWATVWLVVDLVRGSEVTEQADTLLAAGGLVWLGVIIAFGLLYWELDGGGPGRRAHRAQPHPDLAFPQHLSPEVCPPAWRPMFIDYLYLSFTNAMAFSPTDVMPLAHWAKMTMALESAASLVIIGLVIARAVNILA
jgi:uncharacterized membrane protein